MRSTPCARRDSRSCSAPRAGQLRLVGRNRRRGTSCSSSSPTTSTHLARAPSAFEHFPAVGRAGIQKFVNGPFTFSPDGNPLVGPIQGITAWSACAVMAGLSQGGGVGLSLAQWMVHAATPKVRENYSRRFRITFPNEELPAARPLHTTPIYDRLHRTTVWGLSFDLERRCGSSSPVWSRSRTSPSIARTHGTAWPRSRRPCASVSASARPRTSRSTRSPVRAAAWLQGLFTNGLPKKIGRTNLTAMLNPQGKIVGEFSRQVAPAATEFFLFGSQAAEGAPCAGSSITCRPVRRSGSRCSRWPWWASRSPALGRATCSSSSPTPRSPPRTSVHGVPAGRPRHGAGG
ncbi:MAG: hypothetical protein R2713_20785 [Ilumatobacteraceae bacterium]